MSTQRRDFLRASALVGAGLLVSNCRGAARPKDETPPTAQLPAKQNESDQGEVTATEDLMREHGVLRRALLIYTSAATMLRAKASSVSPEALGKTAALFRSFGEDYHEKRLEEAFIFPAVEQAGGPAGAYADILIAQHQRGREITDYITSVTQGTVVGAANVEPLARALESLVLMYRHHAAREDTIIFPAWKQTLSPEQLDEMNDKFEDIEHEQFGEDGFEDAIKQIGGIEASLGIADISQFTAPPPPKL